MSSPADFRKHEKSQKICLKTPVKSSCIFNANFNDFCFHFGSQNPSKKLTPLNLFSTFFPKHVQDAPKTPPRHLQDASKTLQEASKTPLRRPKTPPGRLWTAQRRLQAASSCLETPQEYHKIESFEKSSNFLCFSSDFSTFFMLSGFPWRGKGQTPLSKQFIC